MSCFSLKNYILDCFDKNYRAFGFNCENINEHKKWRAEAINKIKKMTGFDKMTACDFNAVIEEKTELAEFIREKVVINTQENIKMPLYVLRPKDKGFNKAVIAIHGHSSDGKNSLAGVVKDSIQAKYEKYNYSYAMELVKMGFTVYIPDLCGSGERREKKQEGDENIAKASCNDLNFALISVGQTLAGIILFDLIRLLDYIEKDSNVDKVGCVGFSGGGLYTLLLSALDERIDMTVVSGYFHGYRNTILENNLCGCNFIPNLWQSFDCGDFGAMVAPRKLVIETGKEDKLNGKKGIENVYPQLEITQKAYGLYEKEENVKFFVCEGGHKWFGSTYPLIKKWGEKID